ncbi:response regulator transcription factor [Dehalococcoides mccartyi]|uniref:DNA-binding response regulator n=1 Tax=Dehalococcoides mccartyi (strain VS) TaxID=311424 RepID=D2BJJ3_DEHMV|nr:response regulator transcription factor [Dehalococcoides mccartyi]ACZ62493.1 DNA-binding response regulator [Dehalococcoides mccartyi VS]
MKTLIIEDDLSIIDLVALTFSVAWPDIQIVRTQLGKEGIEMAETEVPDFIILDLGLPDMSGIEVLQEIRRFSKVPVIVLTVKKDEMDVVVALSKGADEFISKPFRQMELISRVKNVLKRSHPSEGEVYAMGNLTYYPALNKIESNGHELKLSPTENIIFLHLANQRPNYVTYRSLASAIWGDEYPGCHKAIRVLVNQLREKLASVLNQPDLILTKYGLGYYLGNG